MKILFFSFLESKLFQDFLFLLGFLVIFSYFENISEYEYFLIKFWNVATTPSIYFCFLFHLSKNLLNFSHFSNTAHKTQIYALAKVFILNRNCSNCAVFIRLLPEQCLHKKTRSEPSSESGSKNFK